MNDIIKKHRQILENLKLGQSTSNSPDDFNDKIAQEESLINELVEIASHKITGKELAEEFGNFVNSSAFETKNFIEVFKRQHRTLQQSIVSVMLQTIEAVASENYRFDARNEDAHNVAKTLIEGFKMTKKDEFKAKKGGVLTKYDEDYINSPNFLPSKHLGHI